MNEKELEKEIRFLQETSPLKQDYENAVKNGRCECRTPLSLFAGTNREYCFKCKKVVI